MLSVWLLQSTGCCSGCWGSLCLGLLGIHSGVGASLLHHNSLDWLFSEDGRCFGKVKDILAIVLKLW